MSYQVIARKWRPQAFDEVTGQEHVTRTLRNAIEHERLHHAYLFSGARGVGKTTTARLLAKALNCHKTQTPTPTPCKSTDADACPSCTEIAESRSIDVLEFDAASNTQVDKIREIILDNINVAPARDRFKVFIIDEVHMLSNSSFNALLKTLEEPPPGVAFIMATTELHKVPDTIASRTQQFEFRTIAAQKIFERLRLIADAEKIEISDPALRQIARSGDGSMRDAQSNFDQVISYAGSKIAPEDVSAALGTVASEILTGTVRAIADRDGTALLDVAATLIGHGHDLRNFCRDLLAVFRDLLVFKLAESRPELFESSTLSPDQLAKLSKAFSRSDLLRFFHSFAATETELKTATQPRYVLETGLIKLSEMRSVESVETLLARLLELEQAVGSAGTDGRSKAAAATEEKKTLNSAPEAVLPPAEPPAPDVPADIEPGPDAPSSASETLVNQLLSRIKFSLPDLDENLRDHVDDAWLDARYEASLRHTGDDLNPIPGAAELLGLEADDAAGERRPEYGFPVATAGAAAAPALDRTNFQPVDEIAAADYPPPPADATPEELRAYVEGHPSVRSVIRIFRAEITEIRRTGR